MSEKDPLESISKGATKGLLEWTYEKVKELTVKFRERKLAFISDAETINTVKDQRKTSEYLLFKAHAKKGGDLHILFHLGLTLKKLESEDRPIEPLKIKIFRKYEKKGLHIAQVVQSGIFSIYVGKLLGRGLTPQRLETEIANLFENVENTVSFIQTTDDQKRKTDEIVAKIRAHSPKTFILASAGLATDKCKKIKDDIMQKILGYESELFRSEYKRIYFLNKKEEF